jgi:hypothetical protein
MLKYQVTIKFNMDDEFGVHLGEHRRIINQLIEEHTIENYVVSLESMTCWITINARSEDNARDMLYESPLSIYWEEFSADQIFVYDSLIYRWPELSYN